MMTYSFDFGAMWQARDEFLSGALLTLELSAAAMALSLVLAVIGAFLRTAGPRPVRFLVGAYVELVRNTPFLVQLLMLFFGLPTVGIRLSPNAGALVALVLNGSAYTIEIVRAGVVGVAQGQLEAATALGLHRLAAFRLVVLPQALRAMAPALGSQFLLLMLTSSVCSAISANELTAAALDIQGRTFKPFEAFIVAFGIYFVLSMAFTGGFASLERLAFGRRLR